MYSADICPHFGLPRRPFQRPVRCGHKQLHLEQCTSRNDKRRRVRLQLHKLQYQPRSILLPCKRLPRSLRATLHKPRAEAVYGLCRGAKSGASKGGARNKRGGGGQAVGRLFFSRAEDCGRNATVCCGPPRREAKARTSPKAGRVTAYRFFAPLRRTKREVSERPGGAFCPPSASYSESSLKRALYWRT